jgi:hypothetical protein
MAKPALQTPTFTQPPKSLNTVFTSVISRLTRFWGRIPFGTLAEFLIIVIWAAWVGRNYLNLDPGMLPDGMEFGSLLQPQFVWSFLLKCGSCVMWNSLANGGSPAFANIHAVVLHPLIVITNLAWGTINGTKIALVCALAMAGMGQWWLARVLKLGTVPRLWSALLVVAGGHLAGRMAGGVISLVISTAAVSLVFAPALELALYGRRRSAIWLGVTLALAVLSSEGYLQIGLLVAIVPAYLVFLLFPGPESPRPRILLRELGVALLLALLISAVMLLPALHFWPYSGKELDPNLAGSQNLAYLLFNLVIKDYAYFNSAVLGKQPFPYLYINFIGWVPIVLALVARRLLPRDKRGVLAFLLVAIALVCLASSGLTFRALALVLPKTAGAVRNPMLIFGLAVPLIITVSAIGVESLWRNRISVVPIRMTVNGKTRVLRLNSTIIVQVFLLISLIWSLYSAGIYTSTWLTTSELAPSDYPVTAALKTDNAQWVSTPFGENYWVPVANAWQLKLASVTRPWSFTDHTSPPSYLIATRDKTALSDAHYLETIDSIHILSYPENAYAAITTSRNITTACTAQSQGGNIDVDCNSPEDGVLTVYENQYSGWTVRRDGILVPFEAGTWLAVQAPAGVHHYEFRYRPWDVPVGLGLTVAGIAMAIILGRRRKRVTNIPATENHAPATDT